MSQSRCETCGSNDPAFDLRFGCPEVVWDGPYAMRCSLGGDGMVCSVHGAFERERVPHADTTDAVAVERRHTPCPDPFHNQPADQAGEQRRWTIYVCDEPDGQNCASGTHPNILRHECAALRAFHDPEVRGPGPILRAVEVIPASSVADLQAERDELRERIEGLADEIAEHEISHEVSVGRETRDGWVARLRALAEGDYPRSREQDHLRGVIARLAGALLFDSKMTNEQLRNLLVSAGINGPDDLRSAANYLRGEDG